MTAARPHPSHSASPLALALASLLAACTPVTPRPTARDAGPTRAPTPAPVHIRFEHADGGAVVPLVRAFVDRAHAEGRVALVYVGATWCEPCQYFHAAAERGELDAALPSLALLEFDLDRDGARLSEAGYRSQMIPLFAVPSPDGRASGRQIEGSIHGPGSPAQITPRLRAILGDGATSSRSP